MRPYTSFFVLQPQTRGRRRASFSLPSKEPFFSIIVPLPLSLPPPPLPSTHVSSASSREKETEEISFLKTKKI